MYLEDIQSITVYQLVQYVNSTYGTRIEHNKVMSRQMPGLLTEPSFGVARQIVELLNRGNMGGTQNITTYLLNKEQCVVVAAKICNRYLIDIVQRLNYLETKYGETNTQSELIQAVSTYAKYINDGIPPLVSNGIVETISTINHVSRFYYADGKYITGMNGYDYSTIQLHTV